MGNWEWSQSDARLSFSDELQRIFGQIQLAGSATPSRFLNRVRQSDRTALDAARRALLSDGIAYQMAYGISRQDGTLAEVFEEAVAVRDASGRVVKVEGFTQDITERVQAQSRIQHLASRSIY